MENELYPLIEGQQVVTITSGAMVPKIINVTIRNGVTYDRDFAPSLVSEGSFGNVQLMDYFYGSNGIISRDKVYDEPQLSAQINILQRTIANLIEGDDLSKESYNETYLEISDRCIERPTYRETDYKKIMQQEELVQMALHYFKMNLSIALLMDIQELSEEKYLEVYAKTKEAYIKELSGIEK